MKYYNIIHWSSFLPLITILLLWKYCSTTNVPISLEFANPCFFFSLTSIDFSFYFIASIFSWSSVVAISSFDVVKSDIIFSFGITDSCLFSIGIEDRSYFISTTGSISGFTLNEPYPSKSGESDKSFDSSAGEVSFSKSFSSSSFSSALCSFFDFYSCAASTSLFYG